MCVMKIIDCIEYGHHELLCVRATEVIMRCERFRLITCVFAHRDDDADIAALGFRQARYVYVRC